MMKIREALAVEPMEIPEALAALEEIKETNADLLMTKVALNHRLEAALREAHWGEDLFVYYLQLRNASTARGDSRSCYGKTCKALSKFNDGLDSRISDRPVPDVTDEVAIRVKNGLLTQGIKPLMTGSYDAQAQHFKNLVKRGKKKFSADIEFLGMTREFKLLEEYIEEFCQELKMGVEGVAFAKVTAAQDRVLDAMAMMRAELVFAFPSYSPEDVEARESFLAPILRKEKEAAKARSLRARGLGKSSSEEAPKKDAEETKEETPQVEPPKGIQAEVLLRLANDKEKDAARDHLDAINNEDVTINPVEPLKLPPNDDDGDELQ